MIPPDEDGGFVACMEDVLAVYKRPYNPQVSVVCMDEQPVQLIQEVRKPIPPAAGRKKKIDYHYKRKGSANVFMFTEPLAGQRRTSVRDRRTKQDWAQEIRQLLEEDYPEADTVLLICENLNTHKRGSLYDTFEPEVARDLIRRLDIHYTPKHGSWLNVAECELSAMKKQCLKPRIPDQQTLETQTREWTDKRNANQTGVDWRLTNDEARIKLKRLYPQIQS